MATRAGVLDALAEELPGYGDQETTLSEILAVLATLGVKGAAQHLEAERIALQAKVAVKRREGEPVTFEEVRDGAPNRQIRKRVMALGRCEVRDVVTEDGRSTLGAQCVLPKGHADHGGPNEKKHAARDPQTGAWVRWV